MFNRQFIPQLKGAIEQFIKEQFDEKLIIIKVNHDLNDNNEKDSDKIDELVEYLFNTDNDFAHYFTSNYCYEPDMNLEMIIYCNQYLDDNFGADHIIDWKRYRDHIYIISLTAYIYVKENRDQFIALINENKNDFVINELK